MSPYALFVHADRAKKLLPLFSYTLQGYVIFKVYAHMTVFIITS